MDRISTTDSYNSVIANMMSAQSQLSTDSNQLSSGDVASDLQGYASSAETLTAMQTVQSQVGSYLNQDQILSDKLTTQNTALTQVAGAATGASQAIASAVAAGVGDSLLPTITAQFENAIQGLNTTYNGQYIFAGGQVNTPPVSTNSLTALGAAPSVPGVFQNDQNAPSSQISANTTVQTGFLASQLGTNLLTAFQAIQNNGPYTGPLTSAQVTFLQGQITAFNSAAAALNTTAAQNGGIQTQVSNTQTDLTNQQSTLGTMIGNITDTNVAQVSANLQQAQLAMQASAQVFLALQSSSLLAVLTASGH
jgi:flagellar hook-associated protein 3 FlgL